MPRPTLTTPKIQLQEASDWDTHPEMPDLESSSSSSSDSDESITGEWEEYDPILQEMVRGRSHRAPTPEHGVPVSEWWKHPIKQEPESAEEDE